ncbi:MAG: enoyl-CoA hydratase/isomerase family protein, partial [Kaistella sp.]
MNNGFVNQELKNNISEITFGTEKSNSLPGEILELLAQTILNEGAKEEVKAILLKSEGEKAFCAGAS